MSLPETGERSPAPPRYSLITVTHNSAQPLERFWSARAISSEVEWIVVDNASSDGSAEMAERMGAQVIRSPRNVGFSKANNMGLASARGRFIGFINPDIALDAADLRILERVAAENGSLVSPQLLNSDGSRQPNGRGYPLLTSKIRNRLFGNVPRYLLYASSEEPRAVCWLMGAALLGARETFDRIGGWDPHFFLYYEDKDICLRAWSVGVPILLVPRVEWVHGWARETAGIRFGPWRREIASMAKFYRRYPQFLLGTKACQRAHPEIESSVFGPSRAHGAVQ